MSAGSKIEDDKQEYALSQLGPSYISPSGHAFEFYETEENERLVIKHASGSHIEFKADGSVFIKALKDLHTHSSVVSDQAGGFDGSVKGADSSTNRVDTDYTWEIGGRLRIKAQDVDFEIGNSFYTKAGRDIKTEANNIVDKALENASIEAAKSIYMDSKEKRERFSNVRQEIGSEESSGGLEGGGFAPIGGVNVINVTGNTVIENNDPSGGITLSSAGYLNLVCGGERVDITGLWGPSSSGKAPVFKPSLIAKPFQATFTNLIFNPTNADKKAQYNAPPGIGGSYYHQSFNSSVYNYGTGAMTMPLAAGNGHLVNVMTGNKTENVMAGNRFRNVAINENIVIKEYQKVTAKFIFLN